MSSSLFTRVFSTTLNSVFKRFLVSLIRVTLIYLISFFLVQLPSLWKQILSMGQNEEKTSAVHFLRFELDAAMRKSLRDGAVLGMGVDHPRYTTRAAVTADVRSALLNDFTD